MPNPAGPWQPGTGKPGVKEFPPDDNGVKPLPPIMPPDPKDQKPKDPPNFSADLPNFRLVLPQVASGTQPFADGYAWLQSKGYRNVLYLRGPGEDETAIRDAVERHGMRLLVLDVLPEKLDRELVQDFSRFVNDSSRWPLFVFDKKGMAAGTMWYLHFRLTENETDAEALRLGKNLGLREPQDEPEWWQAIDRVLRRK